MQSNWQGAYFDGRSPARAPATVRLMQSGLEIILEDGRTLWWPYHEIRQTQGFYAGEQIRLEHGRQLPEALVVNDPAFLAALHERAPEAARRFHNPAHRSLRFRLTIYAAVGVVIVGAAIYFLGIPAMAAAVAPHLPVSWEEQLGRGVVNQLAPPSLQCLDPERETIINRIAARLLSTRAGQPYTFHIVVVNVPDVNAFAVPGGTIVVFHGLIEKTNTAEEFAGVLAHEMQHVLLRHTTQQLLQQVSTGLLIAAMTGDATGASAFGLKSAEAIGMLRYSRQHEAEADLEGMKMLIAAGIDPHGMLTFFETLKHEGPEIPDTLKYLVNHPQTESRLQMLTTYAHAHPAQVTPLVPDYDWRRMRDICPRTETAHPS